MQVKLRWTLLMLFSTMLVSFANPVSSTTVLTFNIANYNDHPFWSERLGLIVDAIRDAHADVVVLQEVRMDPDEQSTRMDYENTAEQILRKLNEQGDFLNAALVTQPIMYYPLFRDREVKTHYYPLPSLISAERPYFWEGLSIISKLPIRETGSIFLSQSENCKDSNKRATQYVKLDKAGQALYIANIHFSGQPCVSANVHETLNYLKNISTQDALLVVGDFNMLPNNPVFLNWRQTGLIDVWDKLRPNDEGYTNPASKPMQRIDYVWANAVMAAQLSDAKQIGLIGMNAKNGHYPSDHLGLAVTF